MLMIAFHKDGTSGKEGGRAGDNGDIDGKSVRACACASGWVVGG